MLRLLCECGTYPMLLGDRGYVCEALAADLLETYNVRLFPTRRKNQKAQYPPAFQKVHGRMRRRIETTLSQLTNQFHVSRLCAHTHWGVRTCLSNKFGGFTKVFFQSMFRPSEDGPQRRSLRISEINS